jgi:hypothetical protein
MAITENGSIMPQDRKPVESQRTEEASPAPVPPLHVVNDDPSAGELPRVEQPAEMPYVAGFGRYPQPQQPDRTFSGWNLNSSRGWGAHQNRMIRRQLVGGKVVEMHSMMADMLSIELQSRNEILFSTRIKSLLDVWALARQPDNHPYPKEAKHVAVRMLTDLRAWMHMQNGMHAETKQYDVDPFVTVPAVPHIELYESGDDNTLIEDVEPINVVDYICRLQRSVPNYSMHAVSFVMAVGSNTYRIGIDRNTGSHLLIISSVKDVLDEALYYWNAVQHCNQAVQQNQQQPQESNG